MKFSAATKNITSSGMPINVGFSIDMNGKAFNVLSDGMYSDIISSIVRELSSNCFDAHVASGKADVPFEVYSPTAFDPYFAVKDYGTGLRYVSYTANIRNEREGESTVFISGDIREYIDGIDLVVLNNTETARIGSVLYDRSTNETVLRVPGDYTGKKVRVEFDDTLVLYSTYFRSTKDASNDYIGAFGLGSKTPLAYTDNFIVVNRYNGTKRTYNILTNEQGHPQINLMSTDTTSEPNGLEVRLAVNPEDNGRFRDAIQSQLKYFNPNPIVLNDNIVLPEIEHTGKYFILLKQEENNNKSGGYYRGCLACVGNNAYVLDHHHNYNANNIFKSRAVLRFNVGEVMVTSSREKLKYDDATIAVVKKRIEQAGEEYTKYVLDKIDTKDMTDYQKAAFLNSNSDGIDLSTACVSQLVGNSAYRYESRLIRIPMVGWGNYSTVEFSFNATTKKHELNRRACNTVHAISWFGYQGDGRKSLRFGTNFSVKPMEKLLVFIRDNKNLFLKKIGYYLEQNPGSDYSQILIIDEIDKPSFKNGFNAIKELISPFTTYVRLSSIVLPKVVSTNTASSNYVRSSTPTARKFNHSDFNFLRDWEDIYDYPKNIDSSNAYAVKSHRYELMDVSNENKEFMRYFFGSGMKLDVDVYAFPEAKYDNAIKCGFKPFSELIDILKDKVYIPQIGVDAKYIEEKLYEAPFDRCHILNILTFNENNTGDVIRALPKNNKVRELLRLRNIVNRRYMSKVDRYTHTLNLVEMTGKPIPKVSKKIKKMVDKILVLCDNVSKSTVLLQTLRGYHFKEGSELSTALVEYLKFKF